VEKVCLPMLTTASQSIFLQKEEAPKEEDIFPPATPKPYIQETSRAETEKHIELQKKNENCQCLSF